MPFSVFAAPVATITGNFTVTIENVSQPIEVNETGSKLLYITQCPDNVEVMQGKSKTVSIAIGNNDTETITEISISVSGITSSWASSGEISSLEAGKVKKTNITFTIPKTATVELKNVKITVTGKSGSLVVKDEKTLNLKILPDEDTKATIKTMYDNYMSQAIEINKTITRLAKKGKDTSLLQTIFNDIWGKLTAAKASIDKGDYFSAFINLNGLGTKIDLANKEIEKASKAYPLWIYIIIAFVIILVLVLGYLFIPTKSQEGEEEYEEEYEE
ncbi:MAG: hypothetical protein DRO96_00580 [Candidatus Aenigmatarchaeota archaeon]|nr:MAG: hypothetical protein DRO96_00580 [Candidatus Aenigmarchaeota archaeon]